MSEAVLEPDLQDNENPVSITSTEPIRAITAKEAAYCRLVVSGLPKATAYIQAGYNANGVESASSAACQVEKRPCVQAYLRNLREAAFTANVLSLAEKRDYLARLVRVKPKDLTEDSDLVQQLTQSVDSEGNVTQQIKIPDKLKALELDAKLAGELGADIQVAQQFNFGALGDRLED